MRFLLSSALLTLILSSGAFAQEAAPPLVLEEGVLEFENQAEPGERPLYANAYFSPYENLDQKLIAALRTAKPGSTVYMSYYSISYSAYVKVFKELRDKKVKVRLNLYEKEALAEYKKIDDELIADGFDVVLVPNLRNPKGQGSMHTKFSVVNKSLVMTGSANLSASASLANHEHIIGFHDGPLARRYVSEWYEQRRAAKAMKLAMTPEEFKSFNSAWQDPFPAEWVSSGRAEDLRAKLVKIDRRTRNYHSRIQGHFSPEDALDERCREHLLKAKKTIYVGMYTFVNGLVNDLVTMARKGVKVVVVADDKQQDMEWATWVNEKLESEPNIRYIRATNKLGLYSSLHHKYAVIDGEVVLGGSYNWTGNATRYNDENLIVLRGQQVAQRFVEDFASMVAEYSPKGEAIPVKVAGDRTRVLFAVKIPFELPRNFKAEVVITDAAGTHTTVDLRHSRSTGENWLGSVSLARGQAVSWTVRLGNSKGLSGALAGDEAKLYQEGKTHELSANDTGLPQIVHDAWKGEVLSLVDPE